MTESDKLAVLKLLETVRSIEQINCRRLLAIQAKIYSIKYN